MMIALPHLSAIKFSGVDAGNFLHNQLSADVLALNDGETTFACYCEPKGRVLALMLVGKMQNDYYVIQSASLAALVTERLKIYVMRSDVEISVLQGHIVTGLQASDIPVQTVDPTITLPIPGDEKLIGVSLPNEKITIEQARADDWKMSELQNGICWLGTESSGQFLPQMLGFEQLGAINYRKGCYPGQEIVARTHYLGKIKRFPRILTTQNPIGAKPGEKILLHSGEQSFEAVVADIIDQETKGSCALVVTRMNPELDIDQVEFAGALTTARAPG